MIQCATCQTVHVENTLFCEHCGIYLVETDQPETDPVGTDAPGTGGHSTGQFDVVQVTADQTPPILFLKLEDGRKIEVTLSKTVRLGRLDPTANLFPEVDLTNVGGKEKGVSRRHARLIKHDEDIVIEDLGSTNGTFVNGEKLAPYMCETLSNGDCLRLGFLSIEIEMTCV